MQEFTFRHQQTIEGVPFVLLVFVVPFLILLAGIFLTFVPWIFWVAIPVAISIAIGGFQYFKRKAKAVDCIQVDDLGFTSENFGRVQYSDIDIYSIQPHSPYYKPPHSLYFKLHDGKEYLWILDGKKADIEEDVTTFYAFRKMLLKHLMQQETAHTPLVGGSDIQQNYETITPPVAKKGKKWNYKQAYIPLSLVVVLGGVTRTCGEKYFEQKRQEEMTFFRRAVLSVEQDYQNTLEKSRHTAREYAKEAFGTTMLLTNDPDMKLSYVPDTRINKYSSISPPARFIGVGSSEEKAILEKLIQHPDSFQYYLIGRNKVNDFFIELRRSIFSEEDTTMSTVYFTVYNPHESLPASGFRSDTTARPINFSTSVSIPKAEEPTITHFVNDREYNVIRAILKQYANTYFYMAAKEHDGTPPDRFEHIVSIITADLRAFGIDTEQFQQKVINDGRRKEQP